MIKAITILFVIILPCFIFAEKPLCAQPESSAPSGLPALIQAKLEQLALNPKIKIAGEFFHSIEFVSNLYEKNNYQPFWTKPEYIEDAITAITSSVEDGLLPQDYHLEALLFLRNEISQEKGSREELEVKLADLDLLLTGGVIFYADHLLYGKLDPISLEPTWNFGFAPIPDLNPYTFTHYINKQEVTARLHDMRPKIFMYDSLMIKLARYRQIAIKGGWEPVPAKGKIEPGKKDPRMPAIRKRLMATGDLSLTDSIHSDWYDDLLENDIKAFQASHALDPDGVIGAGTFRELNVPVNIRIEAIRVNLERIRWVGRNLPKDHVIINIAAFWLIMVKDDQIVHHTPVVVGKPLNKTPVFRDKMRYIEFNPTWTQPNSIVKNETIPKLKKDSAYLAKSHMVLLDSKGNIIPTSTLNMKSLSASRFPYLVRQEPGPWNALGEMKFMFPNKYDIYLHDTPSRNLFNNSSRAYSHGCIRVANPAELAEKLLAGTEYDRKKINEVVATQKTIRVNLTEPIDILLMYWTCGLDVNKKLFFVPDIYERDQVVLRELDKLLR